MNMSFTVDQLSYSQNSDSDIILVTFSSDDTSTSLFSRNGMSSSSITFSVANLAMRATR